MTCERLRPKLVIEEEMLVARQVCYTSVGEM